MYGVEVDWDATEAAALKANAVACGCGGAAAAMPVLALVTAALSETNAKLAQELGQLQPFLSVFPQECMGQHASFGPT